MAPYIHVVRHAQGHHNVARQWDLVEPDLTGEGINQCVQLQDVTRGIHDRITHVVSSPSWRCIRTAVISFAEVVQRPGNEVILHPDLQEVAPSPCNIPHPVDTIEELGGEYVNTTLLVENPNYRSRGMFSPYRWAPEAVAERARCARTWLRELAQNVDDDAHIVVVTHGGFAPFLVGGDAEPWWNTTLRSYQFRELDGDDDEAELEQVHEADFGEDFSGPGDDDDDDMDDGDNDNDDGGGDGSPGMPRGILKRRRDDDDDDGAAGGGGAKKRKTVSWSQHLERVRFFNAAVAATEQATVVRAVKRAAKKGKKVSNKRLPRDKRKHPSLFVQYNKYSITKTMALRARQIQRFVDKFPKDETFSAVEFSQAMALQPLDAVDKRKEEAWPQAWNPSNQLRMKSINAFLNKWRNLFPGMDARPLFRSRRK